MGEKGPGETRFVAGCGFGTRRSSLGPALAAACSILLPLPAGAFPATVVEETSTRVVIEFAFEAPETSSVLVDGRRYVRLSIPGAGWTTEPGAPAVPVAGAWVALPFDRDPEVRVEASTSSALGAFSLLPAPLYEAAGEEAGHSIPVPRYEPDPDRYRSTAEWPRARAEIATVGAFRFQRAALVRVYPVSYRPSDGQTLFFPRVRVTLDLVARKDAPPVEAAPDEPAWDACYDRLFANPEWARTMRRAPVSGPVKRGAGSSGFSGRGEVEAFRIEVDTTGLYRLPCSELRASGWVSEVSVDSVALWQRSYDPDAEDPFLSSAVPCEVEDADGDGRFDDEDVVIFFGRSFREQWVREDWEDRFTQLNLYWLTLGTELGARMDTVAMAGGPCGAEPLHWTWQRAWFEEEHFLDYVPSRPEKDRTHWTNPNRADADLQFHLSGLWPAEGESLTVHFEDIRAGDGTSLVTVALRAPGGAETRVGEFALPDHGPRTATVPLSAGALGTGENHLLLSGYRLSGIERIESLGSSLDWFEVAYPCSAVARGGAYVAWAPPGDEDVCLEVRVPSVSPPFVYDVSDPDHPRRVDPAALIEEDPEGGFRVELHGGPGDLPRRWWVGDPSGFRTALSVERRAPGGLSEREADYLILCNDAFREAVLPLAAYRLAEGHSVEVATTSEVYDEFGGGFKSTDAIASYVRYGFERWDQKPQYLLLVGDASEDHRGALVESDPDWLPTVNVEDWESWRAASDVVYGLVDGDALPDLFVGRLSAGSPEEVSVQVAKILEYESAPEPELWRRRVVLTADDSYSTVGVGPYYRVPIETAFEERIRSAGAAMLASACAPETLSFFLAGFTGRTDSEGFHLPCSGTPDMLGCVRDSVYGAVSLPLASRLNEGCLMLAYLGHGFRKGIAHELLLADGFIGMDEGQSIWRYDVTNLLESTGRPFFFAAFGCLLGNFHLAREKVEEDVLLEKLMARERGGAVAAIGSSTAELFHIENGYADAFAQAMYGDPLLFSPDGQCVWVLGDLATRLSARFMETVGDEGAVKRRVLFGDPALRLRSRPHGFDVTVGGVFLVPGDGLVVPADSTTASISARAPASMVSGPDSLWVEIRRAEGTRRLVRGSEYTVEADTLAGVPAFRIDLEHPVELADYRIVLGATSRYGTDITREIPVSLETRVSAGGTRVFDGGLVRAGDAAVVEVELPWKTSASDLELLLEGPSGETSVDARPAAGSSDGTAWSFSFPVPSVSEGSYGLILRIGDARLDLVRVSIRSRLAISDVVPYPSPFRDRTDFLFELSSQAEVRIDLFSVSGARVRRLVASGARGQNAVGWDGRDEDGDAVASGAYLYRVTASSGAERVESPVGRVVVLR